MRKHILVWMSCIGLGGCSCCNGLVDVEGKDRHARFTEGELVVPIGKKSSKQHDRDYRDLSLGYAHGSGQFEQIIENGHYVDVNGTQINGPTTSYNKASLDVIYIRWIRHTFLDESFAWYRGGGLGWLEMDFTITDGIQRATTGHSETALHGLVGGAYYFMPSFGLEGSIGIYSQILSSGSSASMVEERLQFFATPAPSLRLHAGYRSWGYSADYVNRSDIHFTFSGAIAGAAFLF